MTPFKVPEGMTPKQRAIQAEAFKLSARERTSQSAFMKTAFGARTMFGVGAETSGAFLKAERRGGLVGGGKGGENLERALGTALVLGLEGSEINDYLNTIATGIQQFQQTGIPFAKTSIDSIGQMLSVEGGLRTTRGQKVGRSLVNYVQGMSQRGITGGLDFMMLQQIGGYGGSAGTGAKGYKQALINLERFQSQVSGKSGSELLSSVRASENLAHLLKDIMALGGKGEGGEIFLMGKLQEMGAKISMEETGTLAEYLRGGGLAKKRGVAGAKDDADKRLRGLAAAQAMRGYGGVAGLAAEAMSTQGGAVKTQARLQNQQARVGQAMIGVVQTLEQSAINTTRAFSRLAKGPLSDVSKGLERFTSKIDSFAKLLSENEDMGVMTAAIKVGFFN